jgi:Ca-activated chloride channel homolog
MRYLAYGALVASIGAGVQVVAQQPTFRGAGDAVQVFATVTDGDGRLVTDLTREQFELRDDGKPQPVTVFDNSPRPIQLVVMLDVSGSMEGNLPLLRAAASQLVTRLLPDDGARVGTFGHSIVISPRFTRNADELRAALPERIAPDAPTPLWRAVDNAMSVFDEEGDARRVVLVLSDGKDSAPTSFRERYVSQVEVIERARREEVMIYAVAMRSRAARRTMPGIGIGGLQAALIQDLPDPGLARVAEETGGGFIEIRLGEDLGASFARVADELHSQYLLGFAPPRRDGKVHEIELKVLKRGLTPRGRKGYVAPKS